MRHGDTALTEAGVAHGWSPEPLNDDGRAEAHRTAQLLRGRGIEQIISSDLPRVRETADIVGAELRIAPSYSIELRTWNIGRYSGLPCEDVEPVLAKHALFRPREPLLGGESFYDFRMRDLPAIDHMVRQAAWGTLLLVVHSKVEYLLRGWLAKEQPVDYSVDVEVYLRKGGVAGAVTSFRVGRR